MVVVVEKRKKEKGRRKTVFACARLRVRELPRVELS